MSESKNLIQAHRAQDNSGLLNANQLQNSHRLIFSTLHVYEQRLMLLTNLLLWLNISITKQIDCYSLFLIINNRESFRL